MKKKLTAVLLTLCMVLGMLPMSAFAAWWTTDSNKKATITGDKVTIESDSTEYYVLGTVGTPNVGDSIDYYSYYNGEYVHEGKLTWKADVTGETDQEKVDAAKTAIEAALTTEAVQTALAEATTAAAAKTAIDDIIGGLELNGVTATASVTAFTAPSSTADGTVTYTVALKLNDAEGSIAAKTVALPRSDAQKLAAIKTTVAAALTDAKVQAALTSAESAEAAKTAIQALVDAAKGSATAEVTVSAFTAPSEAGAGKVTFSVALSLNEATTDPIAKEVTLPQTDAQKVAAAKTKITNRLTDTAVTTAVATAAAPATAAAAIQSLITAEDRGEVAATVSVSAFTAPTLASNGSVTYAVVLVLGASTDTISKTVTLTLDDAGKVAVAKANVSKLLTPAALLNAMNGVTDAASAQTAIQSLITTEATGNTVTATVAVDSETGYTAPSSTDTGKVVYSVALSLNDASATLTGEITLPVVVEEIHVETEATVSGGVASAVVDVSSIDTGLENNDNVSELTEVGTVNIAVSTTAGQDAAQGVKVTLPTDAAAKLAESNVSVNVSHDEVGSLELPAEVVSTFTAAVELTMAPTTIENAPANSEAEKLASSEDANVLELNLTVDGESVGIFAAPVKVSVKTDLVPTLANPILIYYIADDGSVKLMSAVTSLIDGNLVWETNHFSTWVYMTKEQAEAANMSVVVPDPELPDEAEGFTVTDGGMGKIYSFNATAGQDILYQVVGADDQVKSLVLIPNSAGGSYSISARDTDHVLAYVGANIKLSSDGKFFTYTFIEKNYDSAVETPAG